MTNAEKLAKDTFFLAQIIDLWRFCEIRYRDCEGCPFWKDGIPCTANRDELYKWLESEAEEDAEIH